MIEQMPMLNQGKKKKKKNYKEMHQIARENTEQLYKWLLFNFSDEKYKD